MADLYHNIMSERWPFELPAAVLVGAKRARCLWEFWVVHSDFVQKNSFARYCTCFFVHSTDASGIVRDVGGALYPKTPCLPPGVFTTHTLINIVDINHQHLFIFTQITE